MDAENFPPNDAADGVEPIEHWLGVADAGADDPGIPMEVVIEDDRVSFEDSERFEDDSLCSWQSENESLNQKWAEWNARADDNPQPSTSSEPRIIPRLTEMTAKMVAKLLPFEVVEQMYHSLRPGHRIPDEFLLHILRHCFPANVEDIRTYSFITNGSPMPFNDGKQIFCAGAVHTVLQIGYHISAVVSMSDEMPVGRTGMWTLAPISQRPRHSFNVSIRVDRCRIISCNCSCSEGSSWCQHVVAVCMHRIHRPQSVQFRCTIWDSITELDDIKLKKFAQYMINELPREYLSIAQNLIDQLRDNDSEINRAVGAPDPTAGGGDDLPTWCMDERQLQDGIRKILISFVKPAPTVHCDINYLSTSLPQAYSEFLWLMRTEQVHNPDPLWKLLEIVVHMLKRGDENATTLLHAITTHCLCVDQVLIWWYQTRLMITGHWHIGSSTQISQTKLSMTRYNANTLCEEIVRLWRLAALNPRLTPHEREQLSLVLRVYHHAAISRIWRMLEQPNLDYNLYDENGIKLSTDNAPFNAQFFPGFSSALQMCYLDYDCELLRHSYEDTRLVSFETFIMSRKSAADRRCQNLPILRHGAKALVEELIDTEQQITYTLTTQEYVAQKSRSKRHGKKKRKRRQAAIGARMAMHSLSRSIYNFYRRETGEPPSAEDSAAEDADEEGIRGVLENDGEAPSFDAELMELFAAAADDLDAQQRLFACCEAMFCYGFETDARRLAERLATDLCAQMPRLILDPALCAAAARAARSSAVAVDPAMRFCRHRKRTFACTVCRQYLPPANTPQPSALVGPNLVKAATSAQRSISIPTRPAPLILSPTQEELAIARRTITLLKRTIFLLKCLIRDEPLCPVSAAKMSDYDGRMFRLVEGSGALRLGIAVLLNGRSPAPTKQLEIKILMLEQELFRFLNAIRISAADFRHIRRLAVDFLNSEPVSMCTKRYAVPPILFGHYILNALSYSLHTDDGGPHRRLHSNQPANRPSCDSAVAAIREPNDELLAIAVALSTLQMKVQFAEKEHMILYEALRRQRSDLTILLLTRNSSSRERLNLILDRFLDADVHCIYTGSQTNGVVVRNCTHPHSQPFCCCWRSFESALAAAPRLATLDTEPQRKQSQKESERRSSQQPPLDDDLTEPPSPASVIAQTAQRLQGSSISTPTASTSTADHFDFNSDSASANSSSNIRPFHAHSSVESHEEAIAESDSGSSAISRVGAAKLNSSRSATEATGASTSKAAAETRLHRFSIAQASEDHVHNLVDMAKRMASDAGGTQASNIFNAHNLYGQVAGVVGAAPNAPPNAPDRQLQMCAFVIGLYALGINNQVSESWPTRTYSTLVSWIASQTIDLGADALQLIIDTWEAHLTPGEAVTLIDKACHSGADDRLSPLAARLALSVLHKAYALTVIDCQKALNQCKEYRVDMLEKACLVVEEVAQHDGISPSVLFKVAEHWYQLYEQSDDHSIGTFHSKGHSMISESGCSTTPSTSHSINPHLGQMAGHQMAPTVSVSGPMHRNVPMVAMHYEPAMMMQWPGPPPPPMGFGGPPGWPLDFSTPPPQRPPDFGRPPMDFSAPPPPLDFHPNAGQPHRLSAQFPPTFYAGGPMAPQQLGSHLTADSSNRLHSSHSAPNLQPGFPHRPMDGYYGPHMAQMGIPPPHYGGNGQHQRRNLHIPHPYGQQPPPPSQQHSTAQSKSPTMGTLPKSPQSGKSTGSLYKHSIPPNSPQWRLFKAHEVGMRALDKVGTPNFEDNRSYSKYSRTPEYSVDIKLLMKSSIQLGEPYVRNFCEKVAHTVASPFLLELILESALQRHPSSTGGATPFVSSAPPPVSNDGQHKNPRSGREINYLFIGSKIRELMLQLGYAPPYALLGGKAAEMLHRAAAHKLNHSRFCEADKPEIKELIDLAHRFYGKFEYHGPALRDTFFKLLRKQKNGNVVMELNQEVLNNS